MGRIQRVKGKYYDTGTSNRSFLQLAKDLKILGVKNYYFMLELCDPSLINVDPFAPTLSRDAIARIANEITRNMWYYIREICRIPDQGGQPVQYLANRGNIAQAWCISKGLDSWLNIPRQQGKTQSALAELTWGYGFGTTNSQMIFINKAAADANVNLQRLKSQIELLPRYLQQEKVYDPEDGKVIKQTKNATKMRNPITNNEIITKGKATSLESALNIARGLTAPLLHFDEVEFTSKIRTIVENSAPSYQKSATSAEKNHAMHARIFTSTPGDLDTAPGVESQMLLDGTAKWTEKLYDMSMEDIKEYIRNNSTNDILYIEYSYKQLGLSEEWFDDISRKIGNPLTVKREILLQRLRGSSDSPFDPNDVDYLVNNIQPVIEEIMLYENYRLDIYDKLNRKTPYIVGIDCSTGTNGDNNAITVIDPYILKPVAEFKCKYIGETDFCKIIIELVQKIIPKSIIVIERNSVGDAIIDFLLHSNIRQNLYFDKAKDLLESSIEKESKVESILKKKAEMKKFYGVFTIGSTREDMMAILFRHITEFKDSFVTSNIINDITRLVRSSSGKIQAQSGFHDDSIMSYLMGLYVYYHGNNLPLFGFIKGSKDIENQNTKGTLNADDFRYIEPELYDIINGGSQDDIEYNEILKHAIAESQQHSRELAQSSLSKVNNIYSRTPDDVIDDGFLVNTNEIVNLCDELNN